MIDGTQRICINTNHTHTHEILQIPYVKSEAHLWNYCFSCGVRNSITINKSKIVDFTKS